MSPEAGWEGVWGGGIGEVKGAGGDGGEEEVRETGRCWNRDRGTEEC